MSVIRFLRILKAVSFTFPLAVLALTAQSCSPPLERQPSSKIMSFEEFSRVSAIADVSAPAASDCDKDCQSRRLEFRYVVYVGKQIYCYWDLKKAETKTDFDALASELEKSITNSTTNSQYYLIFRKWAASFHDGHVNAMIQNPSFIQTYSAPIRVEVLAPATDHEKIIVSTGDRNMGLEVGDEILEINHVPARDAVSAAAALSSGSTERMRRYFAGRSLVDAIGAETVAQPFTVTVKSLANDKIRTVSMYRNVQIDADAGSNPSQSAGSTNTGAANIKTQILPNAIGYLRIDEFSGSQDESLFEKAMERLSGTRGLILDLRKNGGGDLSGDKIIARLASSDVIRYKRSERLTDFIFSHDATLFGLAADASGLFATWHDLTVTADKTHHYGKPVVALISPWCFSACDTFSASLKANHLATFVGEATGGGTGTPLVFNLPNSPIMFRYSIIRGQTPNGSLIEGNGTQPDVYNEPTASDRSKQFDGQLAKAVEVLEGKIADPSIASFVEPIWAQDLSKSPTFEQNQILIDLKDHDER